MTDTITLIGAAGLFRVHPRTICRALTGVHNTYWFEDINEDPVSLVELAGAYGTTDKKLKRVIQNRDALLTSSEAADALGIKPRTFRSRVKSGTYNKVASGNIVRFYRSEILSDKIARE